VPYEIRRAGRAYQVIDKDTGAVHAKHTTRAKAKAQLRTLEGAARGFHPVEGGTITRQTSDGTPVRIHVKPKRRRGGG
jgi:hypothetical protein